LSNYDIIPADHKVFNNEPWEHSTCLVVIPGGRDLVFLSNLEPLGIPKIKNYVDSGGSYLGICAGAYLASDFCIFENSDQKYRVVGERPLKFCPASAIGSVSKGFIYDSEFGAECMDIEIYNFDKTMVYVNGGPYFKFNGAVPDSVSILAKYSLNKEPAIVECKVKNGKAILSGPHLEIDPVHVKKQIDFYTENGKTLDAIKLRLLEPDITASQKKRDLLFINILQRLGLKTSYSATGSLNEKLYVSAPSHNIDLDKYPKTPAIYQNQNLLFDITEYRRYLSAYNTQLNQSTEFGDFLLYVESIDSTQKTFQNNQEFFNSLPDSAVLLASHQTNGKGRGTNSWISNKGCLQFSIKLIYPHKISVVNIQYLFGLSVIEAIRDIHSCKDTNLFLKWPNDIYAKTSEGLKKIGGVLINSEINSQGFTLIVGCGINISNSMPSTCLNDLIETKVCLEEVFAYIMGKFQKNYGEFLQYHVTLRDNPFEPFQDRFYFNWLHT
jgi:biotin--protein ligase